MSVSVKRYSILDRVMIVFLVIHFTSLYGFLGMYAGLPGVQSVSIITLLVCFSYIFYNLRTFLDFMKNTVFFMIVFFMIIAPVIILFLQFIFGLTDLYSFAYWAGVILQPAILFVCAALVFKKSSGRDIAVFFLASLALISIEFVVNYTNYALTRNVLVFMSSVIASSTSFARAMGFFGIPNTAAAAVVMCAFMVCVIATNRFSIWMTTVLIWSIGLIALTGSRTALLAMFLILVLVFWRSEYAERGGRLKFVLLILGGLVIVAPLISSAPDLFLHGGMADLAERYKDFYSLILGTSDLSSDSSLSTRTDVVSEYLGAAIQYPLLGMGFDEMSRLLQAGDFSAAGQISWVQWPVEFGFPYTILGMYLFIFVIYKTYVGYRSKNTRLREASWNLLIIMPLFLFYSISFNDLFLFRGLTIPLGIVVGRYVFVLRWLHFEAKRGASPSYGLVSFEKGQASHARRSA